MDASATVELMITFRWTPNLARGERVDQHVGRLVGAFHGDPEALVEYMRRRDVRGASISYRLLGPVALDPAAVHAHASAGEQPGRL